MHSTGFTRRQVFLATLGSVASTASTSKARTPSGGPIVVTADRFLTYGNLRVPCVVGYKGITSEKREGDGATPAGRFPLRQLMYRADRLAHVETALPTSKLGREDAWCDDPKRKEYNTLVRLPFTGHRELLWREDHLYDVLIVLGYNDSPVVPGRGSAIFLHVASPRLAITNGCIAITMAALLEVARDCDTRTVVDVAVT